jgi:large repetitive protein
VQGAITNYEISASQAVCAGTAPAQLDGQTPTGDNSNFSFQWQQSSNGSSWSDINGATEEDYQPATLTTTTWYRRRVNSGSCMAFSAAVKLTVNEKPVLTSVSDLIYCNNSSVSGVSFSSTPTTGVTYTWINDNTAIGLAAAGSGGLPAFTALNGKTDKTPEAALITVTPTNTNNGLQCPGDAASFHIIVLPSISLQPIKGEVVCSGSTIPALTPTHNAGSAPGSSVAYSWTVSGSGISLVSGNSGFIPEFTTHNPGSSDLVAIITVTPQYSYSGKTCAGTPLPYTITVKPSTPTAHAGPDAPLCAQTSYTMKASATGSATGAWKQLSSPVATIVEPTSPTSQITGLQAGNTYQFEWTVSGFAGCAPTKDEVSITVYPDLTNLIDATPQTICAGQPIFLSGQVPTGGNGSYQYQWQFSTNQTSWTDVSGQTGKDLTFTPTQSGFVRRVVTALPCAKESEAAPITVQAAVTNNTISADQSICTGTQATIIQGSSPSGANGVFYFQWQKSTDNGTSWLDIPSAIGKDYWPSDLQVTTKFRRMVSSDLCSGPQSSASNNITITVNPDAQASFTFSRDTACAPFTINSSVLFLQELPEKNRTYEWYINGNLVGSGNRFPGYTLSGPNESVLIGLKAISKYGCKDDVREHRFFTVMEPEPAFTLSTTSGCGPLSVEINNTTPNTSLFTYYWTFGDGQTSMDRQPGTVVFGPSPTYNDTSYTITLHAISPCDTIRETKSVLVKSKPKALFTPNKTVGCSPMRVIFNNTSMGKVDGYSWDFGDGTTASATTADTISHTFITGVRDTFYVTLRAANECGADALTYAIVVSPNKIYLDFAVNGNQQSGCAPHTVRFVNNSKGASSFRWDFGDGNVGSTTRNIDTVAHQFQRAGTYLIQLWATNGCTDTSTTEEIIVYPRPQAAYAANTYEVCIGDSVRFTNTSDSATAYIWQLGDGSTSTLVHPVHQYTTEGMYTVTLEALRTNASGSECSDTTSRQIRVVKSRTGWFDATDTVASCAPLRVTFTNRNTPAITAAWEFGDATTGSGNVATHTFRKAGVYPVALTVTVPGGCTYVTTRTVQVLGPGGSFSYQSGYLCNERQARFQVQENNTDSIRWSFGDGTSLVSTNNVVYHSYAKGGSYLPSVTLIGKADCRIELGGTDSIKVDKIKAGFTTTQQRYCGWTSVAFADTSHAFFGKVTAVWNFGDGTTGSGHSIVHDYKTSGTYTVQLIVTGHSGCSDTLTRQVTIKVNDQPVVAIQASATGCTNTLTQFRSNIRSIDSVSFMDWTLSDGVKGTSSTFTHNFAQSGVYTLRLIAGTVNGCYDTTTHSIQVNTSPTVTASKDQALCLGKSTLLHASGAAKLTWSPVQGLSCTSCADPIATPLTTTAYVVRGTNAIGCSASDTVLVTVIGPLNMKVSSNDSICIGQTANLLASGATTYHWSPAEGLSSTTASNPTATPSLTTTYRVVGDDGFDCFTDTAFVTVAIGPYPTITLGADLTLSTGTLHPLSSVVQYGPIRRWEWSPTTDLSCSGCPQPVAHIKKDVTYIVKGTTAYGCSATDTISIKVFCQNSQVFVPNAFTPDGDGANDILMVRAKGVAIIKSFRIFNRWGEVVFEQSNFTPNDPRYGWDGKIRGTIGGPDVYVYTAEVICENGVPYTYKGNVSILK